MGGRRTKRSFDFSLPSAPVPVSAVYTLATRTAVITFDQALATISSGTGNPHYTVRRTNQIRTASTARTAAGSTLTLTWSTLQTSNSGLDGISYDGSDSLLTATDGTPVAAFTDFPYTAV